MSEEAGKTIERDIERMLRAQVWAVVGASTNPEKYGSVAFRMLREYGRTVYPINPRGGEIDGIPFYPKIAALPETPEVVVAVVPPEITERLVDELVAAGIKNVWMQPGAESSEAVRKAREAGLSAVYGGPCVMVGLRTHFGHPGAVAVR